MICQACRLAGVYNSIDLPDAAVEKHDECEGHGCDCQHRIGVWTV